MSTNYYYCSLYVCIHMKASIYIAYVYVYVYIYLCIYYVYSNTSIFYMNELYVCINISDSVKEIV